MSENEKTTITLDAELVAELQRAAQRVAKATVSAWVMAETETMLTDSHARIKFLEYLLQELERRRGLVAKTHAFEVHFATVSHKLCPDVGE
jgi:hypothetical protein